MSSHPLVLAAALVSTVLYLSAEPARAVDRPNIVLIMCDDMGYSDLGCYGGEIQTPNIDRLAAEGLRFTQFYNCAKCTTTRASLITGLHPRQGKGGLLRANMVTIAEVLRQSGYQTSLSGKWHLGSTPPRRPIDRGFDEYYGLMDGGCSELPEGPDFPHPAGPKEYYTSVGPGWGWAQCTPFRRYKSWVHEGGISTPLIVRWPGAAAAGAITNQVGHVIDFLPTCIELAGAQYPETYAANQIIPCEGKSLVPIFQGHQRQPHETISWYWSGNRAIRQGKWKLVWDKDFQRWELFDLEADRTELNDLADQNPDRVKQMADLWFAWAEKTGVKVAVPDKKRQSQPNDHSTTARRNS